MSMAAMQPAELDASLFCFGKTLAAKALILSQDVIECATFHYLDDAEVAVLNTRELFAVIDTDDLVMTLSMKRLCLALLVLIDVVE